MNTVTRIPQLWLFYANNKKKRRIQENSEEIKEPYTVRQNKYC
jgi:hypothetical protein